MIRRARVLLVVLAIGGCRRRAEPIDAAPDPETLAIGAGDEVLFLDLAGRVQRAAGVESVPAASRQVIAVDGPDGPGGHVWVAAHGELALARRSDRAEFEQRALAMLPPGASASVPLPEVSALDPLPPPSRAITVYEATWCAPCADARAWLDARRVAHVDRNVERDGAAARDLAALCAWRDIPSCRIPVIDLAGKVVVGFDPARLATILGESI